MTCVVGLVDGGKVYVGADSAGLAGWQLTVRADAKCFEKAGFAFGFTDSFRMGQLLQHALCIPSRQPDKDLQAYLVTDFIDAVRDCFKAGGLAKKESDVETAGTFLAGHAGRLFRISSDFQVGEPLAPYDSVGCGSEVALGVLYATEGQQPQARVLLALRAAEAMSGGVRGPFHIVSV